jgi:WD40 repeat protein
VRHAPRLAAIRVAACVVACVPAGPAFPAETPPSQLPRALSADDVQLVIQTGHTQMVSAVAMSRDGRYILTGSQDTTAKLWDVASGQEVRTITGFEWVGPRGLGFIGEGAQMFVADREGIAILDAASSQKVGSMAVVPMTSPLLSADGRVGVDDRRVAGQGPRVIDPATGRLIWAVPLQGMATWPVAMSADGRTLLTQSLTERGTPEEPFEREVWDVAARKLRGRLALNADCTTDTIMTWQLSPNGSQLVCETRDRSLSIIDLATSKRILNIATGAGDWGSTTTLRFSPDGTKIAFATIDGHAKVWAVPNGRLLASLPASAVNFSADGNTAVFGRADGGAPSVRDLNSGVETALGGGARAVIDVAVIGDGQEIAAAIGGGVSLWDLANAQMLRSFNCASGGAATSVAASNAAPLLAVGCKDGSVLIWNFADGERIREIPAPESGMNGFTIVRFSQNGRVLAVAARDIVTLFDADSGRPLHQIKLPPGAADPELEQSLREMPAQARERFESLRKQQSALMQFDRNTLIAMAIHPGGRVIAVASINETSLWDADSGQLSRLFGTPTSAATRSELPKYAQSLAFSPDGRTLLSSGTAGAQLWDVATGQEIRVGRAPAAEGPDPASMARARSGNGTREGTAFSADGRLFAMVAGGDITVSDLANGEDVMHVTVHSGDAASLAFVAGGRLLVSAGRDGALRVWTVPGGIQAVSLIALGAADYVAVTSDQYYRASKTSIKGVAFRTHGQIYPFEQFDLRFNRPDIVMQRIGLASPQAIQGYANSYARRLRKMGFSESMLGRDFHLPEVALLTKEVPVSTADAALTLNVRATDDRYALDRLNVYVNDVPLHGSAGLPFAAKDLHQAEIAVTVPLAAGRNKVQVSALNVQGTESLKQTVYTTSTANRGPADIYVVAIGVSHYKNSAYDLRYAAKDAADFLSAYKSVGERPAPRGAVHLLDLTNGKATREGIRAAKQFLQQTRTDDLAVVFAAGHGMTDARQNYYFGTWDINPAHPEVSGLPYEDFENLLDGIPALKKMLLIDTCFSGEIDQDESIVVAQANGGDGAVKMRAFKPERGISVVAGGGGAAGSTAVTGDLTRIQQDWFADLRRGTGAVVISSASGNEYALEGEEWHNGVFTYALLSGLKNHAADSNNDGVITVGELQAYVIEQVRKLTGGGQNPTVRRDNLDYDFAVF